MSKSKVIITITAVVVIVLAIFGVATFTSSTHETQATVRETIPSEEYEEVTVEYEVPLDNPGGASVPNAVYTYRLDNPVTRGKITVIGYEQIDNVVIVEMDINGEHVTYEYELPSPFGDD